MPPNDHSAVCPQCHKQVVFAVEGDQARCPACGFGYQRVPPVLDSGPERNIPEWRDFFKVMLYVLLIMGGIVVVGVAVLFAGCAVAMKGI